MASYSVAAAKHATLGASTVDTVTFTDDGSYVEVVNRDGLDAIYFTTDGSVPAVGADNTFVVPAIAGAAIVAPAQSADVVKLISASAVSYSVTNGDPGRRSGGGSGSGSAGAAPATAGTGTKSNVASSASSVTILAANTSRKRWSVYNDSTAILYLDSTGGTASATSYSVQIPAGGYFEGPQPVNTGLITGIWASANGNARVTEFA